MTDLRRTRVTGALGPAITLTRVDTTSCRLVVDNTVNKGQAVVLSGDGAVTVGADEGCSLHIPDPTVSGEHARFQRTDNGVLVVDLGSTNGTYYERSRVREVVVPFGATVYLGKARLRVLPQETEVKAQPSAVPKFGNLVGKDRRMRQMFSLLGDVAPTDATVVIEGETGTGKELVASALHQYSARSKKPFVVFDCSAVPHDLVESALFGHVKGSFTGATSNRQGAFKRAHGGTIFLDEIGELPIDLQPKLLRAIESRAVQMVGGDGYERVDVRLIAATNRNLKQEVRAGRFREDLYYRLAVVRIVLPALRERTDDLEVLVDHFIRNGRPADDPDVPQLNPDGFAALRAYSWPGNVRELKNVVERAVSLSRGPGPIDLGQHLPGAHDEYEGLAGEDAGLSSTVSAGELGTVMEAAQRALDLESGLSFRDAKNALIEAFEKKYLADIMQATDGNISRAAQKAHMDRKHLRELLKKNGLWSQD